MVSGIMVAMVGWVLTKHQAYMYIHLGTHTSAAPLAPVFVQVQAMPARCPFGTDDPAQLQWSKFEHLMLQVQVPAGVLPGMCS